MRNPTVLTLIISLCVAAAAALPDSVCAQNNSAESSQPEIRTPKPPATPRINGPAIFGVRPGNPFRYLIPATGDRPMQFSVADLPDGLKVAADSGLITGSLANPGEYEVTLRAKNGKGSDEKKFKIVVGETIALTPPMGWNSWNCLGRVCGRGQGARLGGGDGEIRPDQSRLDLHQH